MTHEVDPNSCERTPKAIRAALQRRYLDDVEQTVKRVVEGDTEVSAYSISYTDHAARRKATLSAPQRASLEQLEKRLSVNPLGAPAIGNRDNGWSVTFPNGLVFCTVSSRCVINAIDLIAL